ncbi:MAG: sulfatase-like hydrolase/transferase [Verrucomicrobiales bacterium]|nr:sulfatase-like hydrolase/transferase [Verrucomicrobiales bacterium]
MNQLTFLLAALLTAGTAFSRENGTKPNIIFFLTDDMGYADIGSFGAPDAKTPHIDQLAKDGVKFVNIYAMGPECTPSRTAFLTGRYPQRAGGLECAIGTGNVGRYDEAIELANRGDLGLPAGQAVLAPALKKAGYRNAIFGKWHLGYEEKFSPLEQGFDEFTGFLGGNVEYFQHVELSDLEVYLKGKKPIERKGYTTHLITKDAVNFLNRQKEKRPDEPFFLYLPHAAPHFPFQGPKDDTSKLPTAEEWTVGTRLTYVAMLEDLDTEVGKVLTTLKENGQDENTIIVFASDHGAMKPGLNTPWRDYKGTLFDGGIRVPLIVRWPGVLKPGTESKQVGTLMDLTASFLRVAGAKTPDGKGLDGLDLLELAEKGGPELVRTLYWRSRRGDRTWWAMRDGNLKYVRKQEGGRVEDWLFDLKADPGESNDILKQRSKDASDMRTKILKWEQEVIPVR